MTAKPKKRKKGALCISLGVLMILSAVGLWCHNLYDADRADKASKHMVAQLKKQIPEKQSSEFEEYPQRTMVTAAAEGKKCIGIVKIPSLEVELPVAEDFSYENLDVGACRCSGSAYTDDLVIAAHNFYNHFGRLDNLSIGDEIVFYDFEGRVHYYEVSSQEIVQPTDVDGMYINKNDDWALTLFTCTWSGQTRFTVRCVRKQ